MNDHKFVSTFLLLISQGLNYMDTFTQTHVYTPTHYVTNRLPLMVLQGPLLAHTCFGNGVLWCYTSLCSQLPTTRVPADDEASQEYEYLPSSLAPAP